MWHSLRFGVSVQIKAKNEASILLRRVAYSWKPMKATTTTTYLPQKYFCVISNILIECSECYCCCTLMQTLGLPQIKANL